MREEAAALDDVADVTTQLVRRSGLRTSSSPIVIVPEVGSISRLIIFSEVVLPHPDGPTNITISPAGMVRLSPSTAAVRWPAYRLLTFSRRISAPLMRSWP